MLILPYRSNIHIDVFGKKILCYLILPVLKRPSDFFLMGYTSPGDMMSPWPVCTGGRQVAH